MAMLNNQMVTISKHTVTTFKYVGVPDCEALYI